MSKLNKLGKGSQNIGGEYDDFCHSLVLNKADLYRFVTQLTAKLSYHFAVTHLKIKVDKLFRE